MKQLIILMLTGPLLAGCGAKPKPQFIAFEPLAVRVPSECRVKSKTFIKLRETGSYGLSDFARDWRRGKRLYQSEANRADRCRLWVGRIH
ncbi:MAG: hypothetical protein L3J67_09475 [Hyphomicrobiaceae bacterium]|nr:hypothetical protein [Hyphomicrobiaceae bacterium]